MKTLGSIITLIVGLILLVQGCNTLTADKSEPTTADHASPKPTLSEGVLRSEYATDVSFEDLARNPDGYSGKAVRFVGTVVEVNRYSGQSIYRIATKGGYDEIIWASVDDDSIIDDDLILNDTVELFGVADGQMEYTAILERKVTLPKVIIDRLCRYDLLAHIEIEFEPFTVVQGLINYEISTNIESFKAISATYSYRGVELGYEITGVVKGMDYLSLGLNCVDADGFSLGSTAIFERTSDGQPFKIKSSMVVPAETVKVSFIKDPE